MTYEEAYMNCKDKESFRKMVSQDIAHALMFNKDRLKPIEEAVSKVCEIHSDWSDEEC